MRVLVACEFSGTVRDAFIARGHDAWSCDIMPTEKPGPHIVNDVRNVLDWGWDLMIAHPPCQYLSKAGVGWLYSKPGRWEKMEQAAQFFCQLLYADIPMIAVENPVMHGHAQKIIGMKHTQVIQPYYFGDRERKTTCLWLRGLDKLWWWPEDDLFGKQTATAEPEPAVITARRPGKWYKGGEVKKRWYTDKPGQTWQDRARTFPGIASAMAEQWGNL